MIKITNVFDVKPEELIQKVTEELKKMTEIVPPEWSKFCKTGYGKERPPVKDDWWYTRAGSILRKVAIKGPIGVSKLRTLYGNKKNRGHKPERFAKASGNILRKILRQLETAGLIKQTEVGVHKGRMLTPKGQSFIDKIALQLRKVQPKKIDAIVDHVKIEIKEVKEEPKEQFRQKKPDQEKPDHYKK